MRWCRKSPLAGIALAPLVLPLLGNMFGMLKSVVYRDIEGQHYEFKGQPLLISKGEDGSRWLQVKKLRAVIPDFPRNVTLHFVAVRSVRRADRRVGLVIQVQGLAGLIRRSQSGDASRFRNWLQREVVFPAEQAQHRRTAPASPTRPVPQAAATGRSARPAMAELKPPFIGLL